MHGNSTFMGIKPPAISLARWACTPTDRTMRWPLVGTPNRSTSFGLTSLRMLILQYTSFIRSKP
jgi:hypothetical protein